MQLCEEAETPAHVSPSKPRPPRKVASSPPPPTSAALASPTPTSSRLADLSHAPTPSRKPKVDAEDMRRKMEEKQKQNDDIWASIAASLEPAKLEPTKRTFLSHTASAGSLRKKLPPSMSRSMR